MLFVNRKIHSRRLPHRLAGFPTAVLALSAVSTRAVGQPLPCQYEVAAVIQAPDGPISSSPTFGNGISPNGRYIVGSYRFDAVGADKAYYFDMQTKQFTPLPLLPGTFTSIAYDVNDAGTICGTIAIPAGDKGFIYDIRTGQYTLLEPIDSQGVCVATGITSDGTVCGTRSIGSKGDPVFPKTAFVWSQTGGFTDLGVMTGFLSSAEDIAEDKTVVGYTGSNFVGSDTRAFVWRQGRTTVLPEVPSGLNSYAVACASAKSIVVQGQTMPNITRSFRVVYSNYVDLGTIPPFTEIAANDISEDHVVVGEAQIPSRGFVWQAGVLRNLDELVTAGDAPTIRAGNAIAPSGTIVAEGSIGGHVVAVVLEPVVVDGDADPDCTVNVDDLISVILEWGQGESPADVTGDGAVDVEDLILVIDSWSSFAD